MVQFKMKKSDTSYSSFLTCFFCERLILSPRLSAIPCKKNHRIFLRPISILHPSGTSLFMFIGVKIIT